MSPCSEIATTLTCGISSELPRCIRSSCKISRVLRPASLGSVVDSAASRRSGAGAETAAAVSDPAVGSAAGITAWGASAWAASTRDASAAAPGRSSAGAVGLAASGGLGSCAVSPAGSGTARASVQGTNGRAEPLAAGFSALSPCAGRRPCFCSSAMACLSKRLPPAPAPTRAQPITSLASGLRLLAMIRTASTSVGANSSGLGCFPRFLGALRPALLPAFFFAGTAGVCPSPSKMVRHPAAAPAATSRIWSPTIQLALRSRSRSSAACSSMPGRGLRFS